MSAVRSLDTHKAMQRLERQYKLQNIIDPLRRWERFPNVVVSWQQAAQLLGVYPQEMHEYADHYGIRYSIQLGLYKTAGRRHYYLADIDLLLNWLHQNDRDISDENADWPGIPIMRQRSSK